MKNLFALLNSKQSANVSREALSYYALLGEAGQSSPKTSGQAKVNQAMKTLRNVKLMLHPRMASNLSAGK